MSFAHKDSNLTVEYIFWWFFLVFHVPYQSDTIWFMWGIFIIVICSYKQLWVLKINNYNNYLDGNTFVKVHNCTTRRNIWLVINYHNELCRVWSQQLFFSFDHWLELNIYPATQSGCALIINNYLYSNTIHTEGHRNINKGIHNDANKQSP